MLKPGGRIVHLSPAANYLDHGFYSFSPTFFADYYHANHYAIHKMQLCRYSKIGENSPVEVFDYLSQGRRGFEVGTLDRRVYNTWVIVEKRTDSTSGIVPQQSTYLTKWAAPAAHAGGQDFPLAEPTGTKADRLLKLTAAFPPLQRAARWSIHTWRKIINGYRRRFVFPLPKVGEYH